jgi:protease II
MVQRYLVRALCGQRSSPFLRKFCSFHRPSAPPKPVAPHRIDDGDEYAWLQDPTEQTLKYLTEENRYTASVMSPSAALQNTMYEEICGRVTEPESSVPERCGDYYYYSRPSSTGEGFPLHCRSRAAPDGSFPEERQDEFVLLDPNELCSILNCE